MYNTQTRCKYNILFNDIHTHMQRTKYLSKTRFVSFA